MSKIPELVSELNRLDVRLSVQDGRLRIDAPKGAISSDLEERIRTHKDALIRFLVDAKLADNQDNIPKQQHANVDLTEQQKEIWAKQKNHPDRTDYNLSIALRVSNKINTDYLNKAWQQLVLSYDILRYRCLEINSQAQLQLSPPSNQNFFIDDHTNASIDEHNDILEICITEEQEFNYDLSRGPLSRLRVVCFDNDQSLVMLSAHSLVCDMTSLELLLQELIQYYINVINNQANHNDAIQFYDFIDWQHEQLQKDSGKLLTKYWQEQFHRAPAQPLIPSPLLERPIEHWHTVSTHFFEIDSTLTEQLQHTARAHHSSLEHILLATFQLLLAKYSNKTSFYIFANNNGRYTQQAHNIIGPLEDASLIHCNINADTSINEFIQANLASFNQNQQHAAIPYRSLINEIDSISTLSFVPKISFHYAQNSLQASINDTFPDASINILKTTSNITSADVLLEIQYTKDNHLECKLSFNTHMFSPTYIEPIEKHYKTLLAQITTEKTIDSIRLLDSAEHETLVNFWNQTERTYSQDCIQELFSRQAKRTPQATAIRHKQQEISFQALHQKSTALANLLLNSSFKSEQCIGIYLEPSIDSIISILAVLKMGAAFMPLSHRLEKDQLHDLTLDINIKLLLTSDNLHNNIPDSFSSIIVERINYQDPNLAVDISSRNKNPESPLYYLFDDATQCIISISHSNQVNLMEWYTHTVDLGSRDTVLISTPLNVNYVLKNIFSALTCGATLVFPYQHITDPRSLLEEIDVNKITVINTTARIFSECVKNTGKWEALKSLRWVTLSDHNIHTKPLHAWFEKNQDQVQIMCAYETIACTGTCCYFLLDSRAFNRPLTPIGLPIQNTRAYILNPSLRPTPVGIIGELFIGGDAIGLGYHNRNALNEKHFIQNPYASGVLFRTNHYGIRLQNGNIRMLSRADESYHSSFSNIYALQLESTLLTQDNIAQAIVTSNPDSTSSFDTIAYIIPKEQENISLFILKELLANQFPGKRIPTHIHTLERTPFKPDGNINLESLANIPIATAQQIEHANNLSNTTEKIVALIWTKVLSLHDINADKHFFLSGGNSLLALQATILLEEQLQQDIPAVLIFEFPILKDFATALDNNNLHTNTPLLTRTPTSIDSDTSYPLSKQQVRIVNLKFKLAQLQNNQHALLTIGASTLESVQNAIIALSTKHQALNSRLIKKEDDLYIQFKDTEKIFIGVEQLAEENISTQTIHHLHKQFTQQKIDVTATNAQFKIFQTPDDVFYLSLVVHSSICDTYALSILIDDFFTLHQNITNNSPTDTQTNNYQLLDFIDFQKDFFSNESELNRQLAYWQQQLKLAPQQIKIPSDNPRSAKNINNDTHAHRFTIDQALNTQLAEFSHQNNITAATTLLACFHILLARYSKQDDICIAIPALSKNTLRFESILAPITNTVILRLQPGKNPIAKDYLKTAKKQLLAAFQNQDIPFLYLLDKLDLLTASNKNIPFCRVAFNVLNQNTPFSNTARSLSNNESVLLHSNLEINPELYLTFHENEDASLTGTLHYKSSLYNKSTIETFTNHYAYLLQELVKDNLQPVMSIQMISSSEINSLLNLDSSKYCRVGRMTTMQRDIYIDTTLNPQQTWNYFGQTILFNTDISPELLEQSIQTLIDLEPNFRTHIIPANTAYADIAYRCILNKGHPDTKQPFTITEHNGDTQSLRAFVYDFIYSPYDLANKLPLRNMLIRFNSNQWVWSCGVHHITVDGFGLHLYILKILDIYEKLSQGKEIKPPPHSFDDYYEYHRYLSDTQETLEYWQSVVSRVDTLSGGKYLANKSKPRQEIEQIFTLDAEHSAQIRKYCFKNRSTPSAYTKALFTLLLKSYFNQRGNGLIFNEVRIGRTRENGFTLGCCFTNQPFSVPSNIIDRHSTFAHLLDFTTAYPNQVNPYGFISNSQQARVINDTDLQFSFNFYGAVPPAKLFGVNCDILEIIPRLDNAIHAVARMREKKLQINLLFSTDIWNDYGFLKRFEWLSQQILNGTERLGDLTLVLPNETFLPKPSVAPYQYNSLSQWLALSAEQFADNIAVIHQGKSFTHRQLHEFSNRLAHHLHALDIDSNSNIALCLPPGMHFMIALLGIIKSGATYIPIDINYPKERITYILNDANIHRLITETEISNSLAVDPSLCIYLDESENSFYKIANKYAQTTPANNNDLDSLLYIIYTSGSTGKPKGAAIKTRGEINLLQWYCKEFAFNENDRNLIISATGFDLTQKNFFAPLLTGGSIVFPDTPEYDPAHIQQLIHTHRASVINCAPSAFYPLSEAEQSWPYLQSLRLVLFGGEPIRVNLLHNWLQSPLSQTQLVNMYGPTECTDIAAFYRLENPLQYLDNPIPIGKANDNVRLYVVDPDLRQLPAGVPGELAIGGEGVGFGYLNREELNKKSFVDNPFAPGKMYLTGDLVKWDDKQQLIFLNRIDFQLKLRGLRIEPGEIEYAIRKLPNISDALALIRNEQLVAYAIIENQHETNPQWRKQLAAFLPAHMIPHHLVHLEQWPLTPNGKIDRRRLPDPDQQQDYVAPRNETEEDLVAIWEEVLNIEPIGIYHDFFSLGGHSLTAAQMASRLRDHFQVELQLRDLFDATTIADIAQVIQIKQQNRQHLLPPITPVDRTQTLALSYSQEQLWLVEQLHIGISAYNMPIALRIKGQLEKAHIEAAAQIICQRHETLRTAFLADEQGRPYQFIHETLTGELVEFSHQSNLDETQRLAHAKTAAELEINTSFDLTQAPLIRIKLIEYDDQDFLLLLTIHHIISDGWSVDVILSELIECYQAHQENREPMLPALNIQYADFSMWQRQWLQDSSHQHIEFWKNNLKHAPNVLRLPTDKPRPAQQTFNGALHHFTLDASLSKKINTLVKEKQITPFMLLLSGFSLLLAKHSNQTDLIIGTPNAGRTHSETENLIGFFVNPLLLRIDASDNKTVETLLEEVKTTVLNALSHQHVPAELIIESLKIVRDPSYPPIAQVGFALQNLPGANTEYMNQFSGLEISLLNQEKSLAKYDLTLFFFEKDGVFSGVIEYNTDLFNEDTISKLSTQLQQIYSYFVTDETQRIDNISLLNEQQILHELVDDPSLYEAAYPLPAAMQDFYLNALLQPNTLSNSIGSAFVLSDKQFNLEKYTQLWSDIVNHFAILRSEIIQSDKPYLDAAYLCPLKHVTPSIIYSDKQSENWSKEQISDYTKAQCFKAYDLDKDELITLEIVQLNKTEFIYIFAFNHILLDGVSGKLLIDYTLQYFFIDADIFTLPEDNLLAFINHSRKTTDHPDTITYWKHALRNVEPIHKTSKQQEKLTSTKITFNPSISKDIKKYCFKYRITPQIFFKTLYGLTIAHYFRCTNDFIIRDTLAGRSKEFFETVACTAESPPFIFPQTFIAKNPDIAINSLYQKMLAQTEEAKQYSSLSIRQQQSLADLTGLQFIFNFLLYSSIEKDISRYTDLQIFMPSETQNGVQFLQIFTPLDIENSVQLLLSVQSEISIELRYNAKNFEDKRFLERLENLCHDLLRQDRHIHALNFVLDDERAQLQSLYTSYQAPTPLPLITSFEQHSQNQASNIALSMGDIELSYHQLNIRANQLARHLLSVGVHENDLIAISLDRSIHVVISILAVMKINAAYLPLDPLSPNERIQYILQDCGAQTLISSQALSTSIQENFSGRCINLDDNSLRLDQLDENNLDINIIANDETCYVIYTSGTTGKPKGCLVSKYNAARLFANSQSLFDFSSNDVWTLYHSYAFDFSIWEIWGALYFGGQLIIVSHDIARSPNLFYDLLLTKQVTVLNQTPSAFSQLVSEDEQRDNTALGLRYIVFGGEPLDFQLLQRWTAKHPLGAPDLINMYGITETTVHVTYHKVSTTDLAQANSIIGHPLPDLNVRLVDQHRRLVAPGLEGEIIVSGEGVTQGYLNKPELSQQRFFDYHGTRSYASGDLARYNDQGLLEYIGRIDQQVKIRGHRIELAEIESALLEINDITQALVLAQEDEHGDNYLTAYLLSDARLDTAHLRDTLATSLPDYMLPAFFVSIDQWPLTANGKINTNALPQPQATQVEYTAPRNEMETKLTRIWEEILGIEKIGIYDNFFELGGHSLIAVRLAKRIQDELSVEIPLAALFNAQDIASLASVLSSDLSLHSCLLPLKAGNPNKPPLFFIHPISGLAIGFAPLSQHLQNDHPVIGIQAFGFTQDELPSISVEEAAERYLEAITQVQPQGPYYLAGYSLGGAIAFEIARKLQERNENIKWFAVIDASINFRWINRALSPTRLIYDFYKAMHPETSISLSELEKKPEHEQISWLLEQSNLAMNQELLQQSVSILHGFKAMMKSYRPKPLTIDAIYISAEQRTQSRFMKALSWIGLQQETLGWEKFIRGTLEHRISAGNHESIMQEPNVSQLASIIDDSIQQQTNEAANKN